MGFPRKVATALTVYGIETDMWLTGATKDSNLSVATALTVYGIETRTKYT